jgi:hypothetical protein
MKKPLLFFLLATFIFFSSCSKSWMEDRLEGSWRLKTAEKTNFINWNSFDTGYENGSFVFQENGTALFTGNQLAMNGDWVIRKVRDNYNSSDGGKDQNIRMALSIHLIDFNAQQSLNLVFDKMHYKSKNRFFAEYESSGYRYRYEFVRD